MNLLNAVLGIVIVLLVPLSRFARARWVPITIGALFAFLQLLILSLWMDADVRAQLVSEIDANRGVQHVSKTAGIIRHAQSPMRITAALASIGLLVTICCWSGAPPARRSDGADKE